MRKPRVIKDYGPTALLLEWEPKIDLDISRSVHTYQRALIQWPALIEVVPAYASLLVVTDPLQISLPELRERLYDLQLTESGAHKEFTLHKLPVHYDGPDLHFVAEATGLTPAAVIEAHSAPTYHVYQLGFLPGFAFLGDLPPALRLPRRSSPRKSVPPGSVAIAGGQTAVYPSASPGGWHLVGVCPLSMLTTNIEGSRPRLSPGDQVKFHPISADHFARIH